MISKSYRTATINRYLFPLMLNTIRLFPRMLAERYFSLISPGFFHSAILASAYHARNGISASAYFGISQKSFSFFMEMILMNRRYLIPIMGTSGIRLNSKNQGINGKNRAFLTCLPKLRFVSYHGFFRPKS